MSLRVSELRLSIDEPEDSIPQQIAKRLSIPFDVIANWRILRKSLDARNSHALKHVYTVEIHVPEEDALLKSFPSKAPRSVHVERYEEAPFVMPTPGEQPLTHRPVIVGSGPGGLAVGYFLAEAGYCPLILERGRPVRDRIRDVQAFDEGGPFDPESNYLFGEGGAGTFSDGKLTYRGSGPDVRRILQLFADHKGKPSILYDYRPHLGSNRLPAVVKALRRAIENLGGEVRFSCRVEDLEMKDHRITGLRTSSGLIPTETAIFAIGHSARDTYTMLHQRGVSMEQKPFQMGVRVEHPQEVVNRVKYGDAKLEEKIGAADYTLTASGKHDVFTFCQCAGGYIMPSVSEPDAFCTNGMSLSRHDSPFANSGLVVSIPTELFPTRDVFAGIRLQQEYENRAFQIGRGDYLCPIQRLEDFLADRATTDVPLSSYPRGVIAASIADVVPAFLREALFHGLPIMDRKWNGRFIIPEATLVGPEARGSAPVRIVRDTLTRESTNVSGLYPVGEGAGYAGGIVSAAVDGLRTAKVIIQRYAPMEASS